MKLLFALGNAEPRYGGTRHNIGFFVLDSFAAKHTARWHEKPKFKASVAEIMIGSEKLLLAKPTTFYNAVGESYHALTSFYNIPSHDVLVVHDELALDFGTLRTRTGGSDAGNNGIKSLIAHGGEATHRLRIGIATPLRQQMQNDAQFVLGTLSEAEQSEMKRLTPQISDLINSFTSGELESTTHR